VRAAQRREPAPHRDLPDNQGRKGSVMAVSVSATPPQHSRHPRPHHVHSHVASALELFTLIAVTGLVTGLIIALAFFGLLDQLSKASH
jgi:hypothetical protein